MKTHYADLGAQYCGSGQTRFEVWAPRASELSVHLVLPEDRVVPLEKQERGYFRGIIDDVEPGARYFFRMGDGKERPDPASRYQPETVHGPSEVVSPEFQWRDQDWFGLPLADYVVYELHVGTFTPEGTFDGIIPRLPILKELGITAIELMPLAQFPGGRNWGYDGVLPYAVQNSYGGPAGLKRLVDAAHREGLAVVLDVVYNHLGPEGNYLNDFGHYFTDLHRTPWGSAINFESADSDEVRRFFIGNALYWQAEFHMDGLRLDAVHAIRDFSAITFLEELVLATQRQGERLNRRFHLIAESEANNARLIRPRELGGYGLDAQWSDDFHHALHALLTGERAGYYEDFGEARQLAKAFRIGWSYSGDYSVFRQRQHGNEPWGTRPEQFVICAQNHDQIGNRMLGERLSTLVAFDGLKAAAGAVVLSPFIPMLFMGEEYGEKAPFQYFTSHSDAALNEAVRKGRREEFEAFKWDTELPDPVGEESFRNSKLEYGLREKGEHQVLWSLYKELLQFRKSCPVFKVLTKSGIESGCDEARKVVWVWYSVGDQLFLVFNFGDGKVETEVPMPPGEWRKQLDSTSSKWGGKGELIAEALSSSGSAKVAFEERGFALFGRVMAKEG